MKEKVELKVDEIKDLPASEILKKLDSSNKGISSSEAENRLNQYGFNELEEKKANPLKKFFSYFWGPIPWMIEIAAGISAVIQRWEDFVIISLLLLLNGVVGFWQENKADNAIELLKQKMALNARVLRGGQWAQIPAQKLVPGDVVRVRSGDIVPADLKLLEGEYLQVDESALTGESLPVEKKSDDIAYSGSVIQKGEMNALVVATGMNTYFGKTTKLVAEIRTRSHFQKAVLNIGNYLIVLAGFIVAIVLVIEELFRHTPFLETLQFALVLIVAAIPAALPAVMSVSMAVGATELAKKGAIVSKLVSIEEMAGMDVLCSDKTGTITQNKLKLSEFVPFGSFKGNDLLLYGSLASREEDNDPIDNAILLKAKVEETVKDKIGSYEVKGFTPFDPVIKHTEATVEGPEGELKVAKGAPQVILDMSGDKEEIGQKVKEKVDSLASKGYRALGVCVEKEGKYRFAGLLGLYDPPHEDSAETIKTANSLNVDVKMVTGDHIAIAKEIASQVGLGTNIITADDFTEKSDSEAQEIVEKADGFAQVFPEHKYRIVGLLQKEGHIVGMTGDGVNDVPALKMADAGIAVSGATDAAKSAADIVFTISGLSVIINAIKESRKIFQRMKSYSIYRIAETVRVLFFIATTIIVFNFYPVTAVMIVLLAIFNDAPIMAIAYDNVHYSQKPEKWNMREVLKMSTFLGIIGVIASFLIYYIGARVLYLSPGVLQSFIFLKLAVAGHLTIFVARNRGHFWSPPPGKLLFWAAVITKLLATLVAVYGIYVSALGWKLAGFVWIYALVAFVITDFMKVRYYKIMDRRG
ncbi:MULTISPECIES: plasma-membrane proton-efflux P-type ATPase [unclassified Methanosarcina]|uniref:plasma-membrane proton-efflux P-type ATPase n=1 Tax=unclassified Methanosarcina TaxID=2644672 RepID=UPI0006159273|nr:MULTISPECIES: plasma-membrane proton-efflux P-type ATPase [unclassified Methanosarcina]AKB18228.1 Lead, cadmium, zinc and mercury transporting ATPase [Methanosarcina sp. WWM596]AKB21553.1 Lead, cadmium, zinc and mercury transporting ATPase [Methanosarcina sp. WH1]